MTICPICWLEMGALINTPNGVMCQRCAHIGRVSPCRSCNRAKCEYCPHINLEEMRNKGVKS